ncbi:MAG: preprotein translocase subunit YajC [Bacteroidales bacterium]|nr:preprotein translocase subunit YajC [Bacteroidales bacterium]
MNTLFILLDAATEGAPKQSPWSSLIFIVLLIVVFWLFFIRPQSKRQKEEQKFRNELKKGDKVTTIGGFHGKIVEVKEHTFIVSLAPDTNVEIEKSAIVKDVNTVGQA